MAETVQQSLGSLLPAMGLVALDAAARYVASLDEDTAVRLASTLKDPARSGQPSFLGSLKRIIGRTAEENAGAQTQEGEAEERLGEVESPPAPVLRNLTAKFLHLSSLGEYTGHSGHSLLDHLLNTRFILEGWGLSPAVCDAGLFHSIYGTETFSIQLIPAGHRQGLRAMIGKRAEQLVYLFSVVQRSALFSEFRQGRSPCWIVSRLSGRHLYLAPERLRDLYCALAANWLEQRGRMPPQMRSQGAADYRALLPMLPERARAAVSLAVGVA